ncbi:hypothetical protein [Nocardioides sp. CER19]|uniref:8-oxoguanine DNA glycosylase OGG fold protein n=1 Tax=Nocardioides sp. CER19 TaxID=3038538 RepID=UPI00244D6DD1|nr:hypothetical protein [Nocardioides sp. CER19]MDH2416688.1 hypothetical protein [Nocardioides sp. CER19]
MIDDDVRADVRAAEDLAGSTPIDGGALNGVAWTGDADRVVWLHPAWQTVEILPEHVRDALRIGRLDLVAVAFACRATGTWRPLLAGVNAWCYGGSEHGVERTRRVLALADLETRLEAAVAVLDADGPVEAYYLLSNEGHVHGWGPALFTRFLDAADRRESGRALGLDPALAGAVNGLVPGSDLAAADWGTAEYAFYLGLLHRVAAEAGVSPTSVEAALAAKFAD